MRKLIVGFLILAWTGADLGPAAGSDWPMFGRDPLHSGYSPEPLPKVLGLKWVLELGEPKPAWGEDQGRLRFDHHYEPILFDGKLFVPSMVRDRLTCYDAETGAELWRFYTDGPVRLAPAAWEGKIYCVSDDGYLYCLDAESGTLKWRFRGGPVDRALLGNGRLISSWPARGAPVVRDGIVYFSASIWPLMGVFIHAVDARTGERVWTNSGLGSRFTVQQHSSPAFAGVAPQGYLAATDEHLVVTGGRTMPAVLRLSDGKLLNFNLASRRMGVKGGGGYDVLVGEDFFLLDDAFYQIDDGRFVASADASVLAEGVLIGKDDDGLCGFEPRRKEIEETDRRGRKRTEVLIPKLWHSPLEVAIEEVFIQCGDQVYCRGENGILAVTLSDEVVEEEDEEESEKKEEKKQKGKKETKGKEETKGKKESKGKEETTDEEEPEERVARVSWEVDLPDEARSVIAGDGRLFVSTDSGRIYCFAEGEDTIPIPVPKQTFLVSKGAEWRFRDARGDPGPKWHAPSFDDSEWSSGPAPLGYGDDQVKTELSYGENSARKPMACYFRHDFEVPEELRVEALQIRALVDDGAAFYINGREVGRLFLGGSTLRPDVPATSGTDTETYYQLELPTDFLRPGSNTLAVEVHQRAPDSSDLLLDLELIATPPPPEPKWDEVEDPWSERAREILALSGARDGYCLAVGVGSGRLATEIARQSSLHVVVVDPDRDKVDAFRRRLDENGAYVSRVVAIAVPFSELELPAYFAELVVAEESDAVGVGSGRPLVEKVFHCLRPGSGVALFSTSSETFKEFDAAATVAKLDRGAWAHREGYAMLQRTAPPTGSADWTHQNGDAANSVVSKDVVVKAPLQLLWFGGPSNRDVLPRHGHGPTPHVAGGRLFIEGRDMLRATDIYTGRLLWQRELIDVGQHYDYTSHEPGANAIGSNYVSLPDAVYVLHNERCLRLDPATGETVSTFVLPGPEGHFARSWGFLAVRDDFLVAGGWPTDFDSPEFGENSVSEASGFWLRRLVSVIDELKGFEPISYEEALKRFPPASKEFRDEDDDDEDEDDEKENNWWRRRFRGYLISDAEWEAHSQTEHRAYLLANLNKLLLEEDMVSMIPEFPKRDQFSKEKGKESRRRTMEEVSKDLRAHLEEPGSKPNDRRALELKRDILHRRYRVQEYASNTPGKFGSTSRTGSRLLYALDRHSGEVLWEHRAAHQFRHATIAVGRDNVYAIDRMNDREASYLRRRGKSANDSAAVVALDLATGAVQWEAKERVFGTWLGYSEHHDVLIQAGARGPDRARDEASRGIVAYRGRTGEVLWQNNKKYSGPCLLLGRRLITQGYRQRGFSLDLLTGEPIRLAHPLSDAPLDWGYTRKYGCNNAIGSPNLLTFRSAAAGFYDLLADSGTSNLGGIRSGCTSNLIPAGGILNAPDYTRTCTCAYQNQVSAAFIHAPDLPSWSFSPHAHDGQAVKRLGLNLGAPGDHRGPDGTLWLDTPSVGGESPDVPVELLAHDGELAFRSQHPSWVTRGQLRSVAASALEGEGEIVVHLSPPQALVVENEVPDKSPLDVEGAVLSSSHPANSQGDATKRVSIGGGFARTPRLRAQVDGYSELASESLTVELWVQTGGGEHALVDVGSATRKKQGFVIRTEKPRVEYFVGALPEPEEEAEAGSESSKDGDKDGKQALERRKLTIESEQDLPSDRWVHLAFTYDAAAARGSLYLDGKLVAQEEREREEPLWWEESAPDLRLGNLRGGAARFAEVRMTNRALDPEDFLIGEKSEVESAAVIGHWRTETASRELTEATPYTVRLIFCEIDELSPGQRSFSVKLQGEPVLKDFDIAQAAKGYRRSLVREFVGVEVQDTLRLELEGTKGTPILSGIQLLSE